MTFTVLFVYLVLIPFVGVMYVVDQIGPKS